MKPYPFHCKFCGARHLTCEPNREFCNDECKKKQYSIDVLEQRKQQAKNQYINLKNQCKTCGKNLEHRTGDFYYQDFLPNQYCDSICSTYAKENMSIRDKKTAKNSCKISSCANCKKPFDSLVTGVNGFCSHECSLMKGRKEIMRKAEEGIPRKKGRKISYDELNRRAEVRRLEEEWKRLT